MTAAALLLDLVIALGLAVVLPIGAIASQLPRCPRILLGLLGPVAGLVHVALRSVTPGPVRALAVLPVALLALGCGAHALQRVSARRTHFAREVVIDFGLLTPLVVTLWLAVYHLGTTFRGFGDFWAALTAAHFLFAGFGLSLAVGLVGRALTSAAPRLVPLHAVVAWGFMLALPVLALGIDGRRSVEIVGVLMYGLLLPLHASLGLVVAARFHELSALGRALLALACLSLLVTTAFALGYGLLRHPALDLATMVKIHGTPNALLVVLGTLTAFALRR